MFGAIVVVSGLFVVVSGLFVVVSGLFVVSSVLTVSSLVTVSVFTIVVSLHGRHDSHNTASRTGSVMVEFFSQMTWNLGPSHK